MKREFEIFLTAIMFYTRISCPKIHTFKATYIHQASRYFPLVGWIVGIISFLVFLAGIQFFDTSTSAVISLLAGALLTGGFHEDGLADTIDGFGGGWTKSRILEIMKDSRIGTYGVLALVFLLLIKLLGIINITENHRQDLLHLGLLFIAYHSLSRLTSITLVFTSKYVREDSTSKAKPIAKSNSYKEIVGAYITGLIPLIALVFFSFTYVFIIPILGLLMVISKIYFEKWIDGYTGDCLGAVEQIGEVVCLLFFAAVWKFI